MFASFVSAASMPALLPFPPFSRRALSPRASCGQLLGSCVTDTALFAAKGAPIALVCLLSPTWRCSHSPHRDNMEPSFEMRLDCQQLCAIGRPSIANLVRPADWIAADVATLNASMLVSICGLQTQRFHHSLDFAAATDRLLANVVCFAIVILFASWVCRGWSRGRCCFLSVAVGEVCDWFWPLHG